VNWPIGFSLVQRVCCWLFVDRPAQGITEWTYVAPFTIDDHFTAYNHLPTIFLTVSDYSVGL